MSTSFSNRKAQATNSIPIWQYKLVLYLSWTYHVLNTHSIQRATRVPFRSTLQLHVPISPLNSAKSTPKMCIAKRSRCPAGHIAYSVTQQCEHANIKWHNADTKMCMKPRITKVIDEEIRNGLSSSLRRKTLLINHPECTESRCPVEHRREQRFAGVIPTNHTSAVVQNSTAMA